MPAHDQEKVQRAYLMALAKVILADGLVEPTELVKFYGVFSVFETKDTARLAWMDKLFFEADSVREAAVAPEILQDDALRLTLGRDAIFLSQGKAPRTKAAVEKLLSSIRLSPEQIEVLSQWVRLENEILRKIGAGEEWLAEEKSFQELVSRAAAVGIPLAVLYSAGIVGLSAVGITSGLAAIGGYTGLVILGLNPMTAGIAGLIMAGVSVKKVSDYALGNTSAQVKALKAELEEFRKVHMRAAVRLASDIQAYPSYGHAARAEQRTAATSIMRKALEILDGTAG